MLVSASVQEFVQGIDFFAVSAVEILLLEVVYPGLVGNEFVFHSWVNLSSIGGVNNIETC